MPKEEKTVNPKVYVWRKYPSNKMCIQTFSYKKIQQSLSLSDLHYKKCLWKSFMLKKNDTDGNSDLHEETNGSGNGK